MLEEYQKYIQGDKAFIPFGVSEIEWGAFAGCTGLKSIEIPNSVTSIGSYAFSGCTGLTEISLLY
ncbi:MAG: leucine-rich repeat protein [Bacteroidales bacterium]|nr:leucine-rich repeat protein [Bacteroidales bacterium]